MRWVAHYLHTAGWNVYSTILAGHAFKSGAWPKVNLKEEYGGQGALVDAVEADPDLAASIANPGAAAGSPTAAANLLGQLTTAVPQLAGAGPPDAYLGALESGAASRDAFDSRFDSTAGEYGAVAEAALRHVEGLPGPIVAVGSSVGGAAALWLGGVASGRVTHVLACAPLLRLHGEEQRRLAMVMGPLGVAPDQGWSADNKFALSCLTGTSQQGGSGEERGSGRSCPMVQRNPASACSSRAHVCYRAPQLVASCALTNWVPLTGGSASRLDSTTMIHRTTLSLLPVFWHPSSTPRHSQ